MFNYLEIKRTEVERLQREQQGLNDYVIAINQDFLALDADIAQLQTSKMEYLNCDLEAVKNYAKSIKWLQDKKCDLEAKSRQFSQDIASLDKRIDTIHLDLKVTVKKAIDLHFLVRDLASVLQSAVTKIEKYIADDKGLIKHHDQYDATNIYSALEKVVELQTSLLLKNPPLGFEANAKVVETVFASIRRYMGHISLDINFISDKLSNLTGQQDIAAKWSQSTEQTLIERKRTLEEAQADNQEVPLLQIKRSLEDELKNNRDFYSKIISKIQTLEDVTTPVLVLNLFRIMQEAKATDFSSEERERIVSLKYDPSISSHETSKQYLLDELLSTQQELSLLNKRLEQESILLREQYRKASFILGALGFGGMTAAIILSYMLSSVVLVAIAGLVMTCAVGQAYYFFNESKKYPREPILQESEQSPVSNGLCCAASI